MTKTSKIAPSSGNKLGPIVFFGSGPVAARSLELLAEDFEIEAVITKPRPEHHRGAVPVLDLIKKLNLPVFTASNRSELNTLFTQSSFKSRVAVLVDFGIIVSQDVIDKFPLGIVNSHFSLLPQWRGADPITFSILSGQKQTGVSLMLLVEAMDEGPILSQAMYEIEPDETTTSLTTALIELSDILLHEILPKYMADELVTRPQAPIGTSYSRKLTKADGELDYNKPAVELEREIRAFSEWPKSHTKIGSHDVTLTKATPVKSDLRPGEIKVSGKQLFIGTSDQALEVLKLKPAGKGEMTAAAFLNGYKIS
ncbi:MAG TPA: methionyl-tRNA formyltransferase [Candidatus Saccharimonadales bacterium]|nr:methionyl-tRNA formyltransferase [Candidatus Saccharimonadales bacterium]